MSTPLASDNEYYVIKRYNISLSASFKITGQDARYHVTQVHRR